MSTDQREQTFNERRAAIEDELRQRLARDSAAGNPAAAVALSCLTCRGISRGDAHFCTHCGARFNAIVIAPLPPTAPGGTESA